MFKVMGKLRNESHFVILDCEIPSREEASEVAMAIFLTIDSLVHVTVERDNGYAVEGEPKVLTDIRRFD